MIARGLLVAALILAFSVSEGSPRAFSQGPDPEAIARAHLASSRLSVLPEPAAAAAQQQQRTAAAPAERDIDHIATQESEGASHVRFQETEGGISIFGAQVVVNLKKGTDEVGFVSDKRTTAPVVSSAISVDENAARDIALDAANIETLRGGADATLVYYPVDDELYIAWQFLLPASDPLGDWLVIVLAGTGSVELVTDVASHDTGQVFDPNPVATGGQQPVQDCDSAANESVVDSEYVTRTLLGIDSGQNLLRGEYVDLTAPGIVGAYKPDGQASSPSHNYVYDCDDDRFEEVMVYYHIDTTQRALQALGFTGNSAILDEPIPAHAHYYNTCNAYYSPIDTGLHFGDCGSAHDTAEDADVIIHEYGHAIQDDQVPGWAFGDPLIVEEARGMGEGFGDFLAAVMTDSPCIGDWVNFGQSSCGGDTGLRTIDNNLNYSSFENCRPAPTPQDPDPAAEEHCTGEIWGGALWALAGELGHDLALTLVIDSHFYLGPYPTFDDGVCAIFAADDDLYGGSHGATIANVFSNRGINCTAVPPPEFPYAFLRIRHTAIGDLVVRLKAGVDPDSPVCNLLIWNQSGGATDDLVGFVGPLDDPSSIPTSCINALPPSSGTPWWLEVQDMASGDTGTIEDFEIVLSGTTRCIAADTPVAIPDGSPGAVVRSMTDCSTSGNALPGPSYVWYFAEGYTGDGWETYTDLLNDTGDTALVQVDYLLLGGGAVTKNITMPAETHRSLFANDLGEGPGPGMAFGVRITSNQPITAQQSLIDTAGNLSHGTVGSRVLSDTWYFAEGFTGNGWLTFISATNPNSVSADVTAIYHLTDGSTVEVDKTIPANGRDTFVGHEDVPGSAFSVEVVSSLPIVSQEVLIDTVGLLAHGTIGSTTLSKTWNLAEGYTGDSWLTFISVGNIGSTPATVTATYNLFGAPPEVRQLVVPAGARETFVGHETETGVGPGQSFGVTIDSDVPVVVQEVLIDPKPGVALGHGVLPSTVLGKTFTFGGGTGEPDWLTFISVTNPGSQAGTATATYYFESGSPVQRSQPIGANSRITFGTIDSTGPGAAIPFGVKIESDVSIVSQLVVIDVSPRFLAYSVAGTVP